MADDQPSPVPTVVVAGLLRLIAAGLEAVTTAPPEPGVQIGLITGSGWWLAVELDERAMPAAVLHAQPPSRLVPPWTWGCQRDDWTLGPDSRVVTPIELLTAEQRQALVDQLARAPRHPWPEPLLGWDVSNLWDELILD